MHPESNEETMTIHETTHDSIHEKNSIRLLAALAKARGFLLVHEVPDRLPSDGDTKVEIISPSGKCIDIKKLGLVKNSNSDPLQNFPPTQNNEDRTAALITLELTEAQLLGWLLIHQDVRPELLVYYSEDEGKLERLLDDQDRWEPLLVRKTEFKSSERMNQFVFHLRIAGFQREHISEVVKEGISIWSSVEIKDNSPVNQTVTHYYQKARRTRSQLLEGNIRLVASIAARYRRSMDFEKSLRDGLKGLNRALDIFERSMNNQLSTYATWWIRQAIVRARGNHNTPIRLPIHLMELNNKLIRTFILERKPQMTATDAFSLVVEKQNIAAAKVSHFAWLIEGIWPSGRTYPGSSQSIEELLVDMISNPLASLVRTEHFHVLADLLLTIINNLEISGSNPNGISDKNKRIVDVLRRRLGLGLPKSQTLEDIGKDHEVTRERIRQIEKKALKRIKKKYGKEIDNLLDLLTGRENG
jgi:RNA polymerase sigma factor (sigma-70 family)